MNDTNKTKRASMTVAQKYDLMRLIKFEYAKLGQTDTEFARTASSIIRIEVAPSTVKHYREGFGIEQIKASSTAELKARIAELEAKLAERSVDTSVPV